MMASQDGYYPITMLPNRNPGGYINVSGVPQPPVKVIGPMYPPLRPIGPAYNGPTGTISNSTAPSTPASSSIGITGGGAGTDMGFVPSSGSVGTGSMSALSSMPWYVWAILAAAAFFVLAQPREVHIRA